MSQPIALGSAGLRAALERTSAIARRVTIRQTWYEFGWRWLAGAAAFFCLDLMFGLPVPLRWLGLLALIAYPILIAWNVRNLIAKQQFAEEHSARLVEEGHPELNNALINAVQFRRELETAGATQADLMRREIERAEQVVGTTPLENVIDRQGEQRAKKLLFATAGVWIAACVLMPGIVMTVLPRMFAPWMDNVTPPFSLTKIDLNPKGATVRFGSSLAVQVNVQGPVPETLVLTSQNDKGQKTELPLESTEPGKYSVTLSDLKQDAWIVANGGGARSGRYLIKVLLPPTVTAIQAIYTYPAYTQRPAETVQVDDKGFHGWMNTKVHVKITANRSLAGGMLVITSPEADTIRAPLTVDGKDNRVVAGDFPITASGKFQISLTAADQQANPDAAHGKITLDPDQRPNVWFDEPAQTIAVTPQMTVTLAVGADDEMGITQVDLHRTINGIADNRNSLYQGAPIKRVGTNLTMDMADLGVRPGDKITYYAGAFDSVPNRPNYAETDAYTIDVVSAEEYKKMLQNQRDEEQISREAKQIQSAIQSLADRQQEIAQRMEKLAKALSQKPGDSELQNKMAQAQKEQQALQQEAKQLAQKLSDYAKSPSASPIEEALKKKVAEAAQAISKAASQMPSAGAKPGAAADAAKKAAATLQKTANQTQKSVGDAMKNLDKAQPLFDDVQKFMDLLNRQGQLVLQSRQFEQLATLDNVDRSRLSDITAEQAQIKQELRALQDDFRRHAADAKPFFPKAAASAVKIADEIGRRQIVDTMGNAQSQFNRQNGSEGFADAKRARDDMEAMVSTCQAGQGTCQGELDVALKRSMGQSGLGSSMGMTPGNGKQNGPGSGSAAGGNQSDGSGSTQSGATNAVAYTTSLKSLSGGGASKDSHAQHAPGTPVDISPERSEKLADNRQTPPKASDSSAKGYLPEYRKMIHDYFISVTKEQK